MPYQVTGWVEATRVPPEEHEDVSYWAPVLSLASFDLGGDAISDYLFGLAKRPEYPGRFAGRGVPSDCTSVVSREISENNVFIAKYGEGDFGHTFASMSEILAALKDALAPDLSGSMWAHALAVTELALKHPIIGPAADCRIIVWADW